jgi:hypothetical protein
MRLYILTLLAFSVSLRLHAAPDTPDIFSVPSPDGKFIFRQTMESEDGDAAFGVIDARTKRSVLINPGASLPPMEDSIACLWAPNSKRFAINARIAGRYAITELFEWTGQQFQHIPSIEGAVTTLLAANRKAQLKRAGIPANTVLHHIWDLCKTLKWEDADTLKVLGSSTLSYVLKKDPKDTTQLVSAFTFILKLKSNAPPKIISQSAAHPGESGH